MLGNIISTIQSFYPRGKKTAPHNRVFTRRWPPVGSPGSWVLPNRPDQDGSDNDAVSKRVWRMWAGEGSRPEKNRDGMEFDGYRRCVPRCARKAVGACGEKRSCKQKKPTLTPIRKRWEETSTRLSCMQDVSCKINGRGGDVNMPSELMNEGTVKENNRIQIERIL